jgi:hypothetical protein
MLYLCVFYTLFFTRIFHFTISISFNSKHHWSSLFVDLGSVLSCLIRLLENTFRSFNRYSLLLIFPNKSWSGKIIEILPNIFSDVYLVFYSITHNRNHGFADFSLRYFFQNATLFYTKGYQEKCVHLHVCSLLTRSILLSRYSVFYFLKRILLTTIFLCPYHELEKCIPRPPLILLQINFNIILTFILIHA